MTQLHADPYARMTMTDEEVGADPTAYTYHLFRWQGPATDYLDDGRRRDPSHGLPPQLLAQVFDRPKLRVGTKTDIDEAVAWMTQARREAAGRLAKADRRHPNEQSGELEWAAIVNRNRLRFGAPITATLDLAGSSRLWLCVHPLLRDTGSTR